MLFFGRKKRLVDHGPTSRPGQLPESLAQLLKQCPATPDPNLLVGSATHVAGAYRLTDDLAVVESTDLLPALVNDAVLFGQIAAASALGGIYALGGTPRSACQLLRYPEASESVLAWLAEILRGGTEALQRAGVSLVAGQAVRDSDLRFGYAVVGTLHPLKVISAATARPGDKLVLTKALGTGIALAAHKADACPGDLFDAVCDSMIEPNLIGRDAMLEVGAHATVLVRDLGLVGHALEMAEASKVTLLLDLPLLPLFAGVDKLARKPYLVRAGAPAPIDAPQIRKEGKLDAVRVELLQDAQTSGGLLISVPAAEAEMLVQKCRGRGAQAASVIGEVLERQEAALVLRP
jgi:selenide,water dikinase